MHLIEHFFTTWRFAVASASLILAAVGLMASLLLVPLPPGPAAVFAESFKIWCFGFDPTTGTYEWAYVWMFLIQPFVMIGFILMIWGSTFKEARLAGLRRVAPYVAVPILLVIAGSVALLRTDAAASAEAAAFPGERIRTSYPAADFVLTDHRRNTIRRSDLGEGPVLVTAVYTSCATSCPLILGEVRRALARSDGSGRLSVVILTLDPLTDTPEALAALAQAHDLVDPRVHFVTGSVAAMDEALESYGFVRSVDSETGAIDHANLFVLLDSSGRVAYRLGLSELQSAWMDEAVRQLSAEVSS